MSERMIRNNEIKSKTGLSEWTRNRLIAEEKFPKPYRISKGIKAFKESEVDQWIENLPQEIGYE